MDFNISDIAATFEFTYGQLAIGGAIALALLSLFFFGILELVSKYYKLLCRQEEMDARAYKVEQENLMLRRELRNTQPDTVEKETK